KLAGMRAQHYTRAWWQVPSKCDTQDTKALPALLVQRTGRFKTKRQNGSQNAGRLSDSLSVRKFWPIEEPVVLIATSGGLPDKQQKRDFLVIFFRLRCDTCSTMSKSVWSVLNKPCKQC